MDFLAFLDRSGLVDFSSQFQTGEDLWIFLHFWKGPYFLIISLFWGGGISGYAYFLGFLDMSGFVDILAILGRFGPLPFYAFLDRS